MNIRISEKSWSEMEQLTAVSFLDTVEFPQESGCILLIAENDHPQRSSLLVSEILAPVAGDLLEQDSGGITFASRFLRRALLRVRERGLKGFLTLHTHPMTNDRVSFSGFDNASDPELMRNLYEQEPSGVFGSVVRGRNSICGRIWRKGKPVYLDQVVCVGERLRFFELSGIPLNMTPVPQAIFDRATTVTGTGAMYRLCKFRVGVIGTSGTGSLMVELLLRAGAGEIVLFEFDTADETNLNRVLHLRRLDVDAKASKAERARDAANETGLPTEVTVIRGGDIRNDDVADELRGCDLLVGCIDRDWPRLILCETAYQFLIPYFDNRNFRAEFVRVNVDAHLGQEEGNTYKNRTKQAHLPRDGAEANFEYELIEHGLKWWPIKSYEARFPKGKGRSSNWKLSIESIVRAEDVFPVMGVPFSLIVTISDLNGSAPVFNQVRQQLLSHRVNISDIRIQPRVRVTS